MESPLKRRLQLLTTLVDEASKEGASIITLGAIVEEASELGAEKALMRCGLHDEAAGIDIRDLRYILRSWRDARKIAWRTFVRWFITLLFALILAGTIAKLRPDILGQ